jgi:hypothetical protein
MSDNVEFPSMRAEVIGALRALSDPEHQRGTWGKYEPGVPYYDDLDMNVHILYDDAQVLPDPESAVSSLLYESEVSALQAVDAVLGRMIQDLGDRPDAEYLSDPRWSAVVRAAGDALAVMETRDGTDSG